jgi:hypothetical protein
LYAVQLISKAEEELADIDSELGMTKYGTEEVDLDTGDTEADENAANDNAEGESAELTTKEETTKESGVYPIKLLRDGLQFASITL